MKAVVRDGGVFHSTQYITYMYSKGSVFMKAFGLEMDLLLLVLKQMNMSLVHVPTPKFFKVQKFVTDN